MFRLLVALVALGMGSAGAQSLPVNPIVTPSASWAQQAGGGATATSITFSTSGTTSATPSTAAVAVAASAGRTYLVVTNTSTTATIYLGSSSVTVGTGIPLAPGGGYLFTGAIAGGVLYAISSTASATFAYAGG